MHTSRLDGPKRPAQGAAKLGGRPVPKRRCGRHPDQIRIRDFTEGRANNLQGEMLQVLSELRRHCREGFTHGRVHLKRARWIIARKTELRTYKRRLAILLDSGVAVIEGDELVLPNYYLSEADKQRARQFNDARRAQNAAKQARYRVRQKAQKQAPRPKKVPQVRENIEEKAALPRLKKQSLSSVRVCEKQPCPPKHRARAAAAARMSNAEIDAVEEALLGPMPPLTAPATPPPAIAKPEPAAPPPTPAVEKTVSRKRVDSQMPGPEDPCWLAPTADAQLERGLAFCSDPRMAARTRYLAALEAAGLGEQDLPEPPTQAPRVSVPSQSPVVRAKQGDVVRKPAPEKVSVARGDLVTHRWVREFVQTVPGFEKFSSRWVVAAGVHVGPLRVAMEQLSAHRAKIPNLVKTLTRNAIKYDREHWQVYGQATSRQGP